MENSTLNLKSTARVSGLYYLLMAITSAIGIIVIPSKIIDIYDINLTVQNIIQNQLLFRFGLLCSTLSQVIFIFLALQLYRLFKEVCAQTARTLLTLVLASVPVSFIFIISLLSAGLILNDYSVESDISAMDLSMVKTSLLVYQNGIILIGVFWGLWLIPFGKLFIKASFMPSILGSLLILGGTAYLLDVVVYFIVPVYHEISNITVAVSSSIAEISVVFWLLIWGIKKE